MNAESASANQARRVVITGVGAVTPVGQTAETFWKACLAGCSGVSPITGFDTTGYSTRFAAEIKDWNAAPYMDKKDARRMATFIQFAVKAACMAVEDSGLVINDDNRDRIGVYVGSGIGGIGIIEAQHQILAGKRAGSRQPVHHSRHHLRYGHGHDIHCVGYARAQRLHHDRLHNRNQ